MNLRMRLLLVFLAVVAIGLYQLSNWVVQDIRPWHLQSTEESLVDSANLLAAFVGQHMQDDGLPVDLLQRVFADVHQRRFSSHIYQVLKNHVNIRVYITDLNGIVRFDSDNNAALGENYSRWNDVYLTLNGKYGARTTRRNPADADSSELYVAAPIMQNNAIKGVLTVAKPSNSVDFFVASAVHTVAKATIICGIVVLFTGIMLGHWLTKPIHALTQYALDMRDGKRVAMPDLGHNEMGKLGAAFEEMRKALAGRETIERYIQSLTHEIKGPLSAINGAAELLQETEPNALQRARFLKNIENEGKRIQDIVDRLLQLAALEKRQTLNLDLVDICAIIELLEESLSPNLNSRDIKLDCVCVRPCSITGERFLIQQAVYNLLINAIDFSPTGGSVSVRAFIEEADVVIVITDQGPGIPEYARQRIYQRFYSLPRPDSGKKSSGLGLCFVKEVMALHHGVVTHASTSETGTTATLKIPITTV